MQLFPTPLLQGRGQQAATAFRALALSLTAFVSQAQKSPAALTMALVGSDPTATAYTGPHYPGGPDSLRAVLARRVRLAGLPYNGEVFLPLLARQSDRGNRHQLLQPPSGTADAVLAYDKQVVALARRLRKELPSLESATRKLPDGRLANALVILLAFGSAQAAVPLAYSEEEPTFPARSVQSADGQPMPAPNLLAFLQHQVRYPAEALRHGDTGQVYTYFEITETGAVEHARIIGSAGPILDTEVLRILQLIPHALTPPRQQGRPVRVYYIQPFTFNIK